LIEVGVAAQEIRARILRIGVELGGQMLNDLPQVLRIAQVLQVRLVQPIHYVLLG
jgi:hypothetical protein